MDCTTSQDPPTYTEYPNILRDPYLSSYLSIISLIAGILTDWLFRVYKYSLLTSVTTAGLLSPLTEVLK